MYPRPYRRKTPMLSREETATLVRLIIKLANSLPRSADAKDDVPEVRTPQTLRYGPGRFVYQSPGSEPIVIPWGSRKSA